MRARPATPFKTMKELNQKQLETEVLYHKYLYYERAQPMITDYEFDNLEQELRDRFPNSKVLDYIDCPQKYWKRFNKRFLDKKL